MAQRRSEETHERILQAAAEGFAQNGYDSTSVAEICERAGVSKGAFYHHFPSKQDVFLELLNHWLAELDVQMAVVRDQALTVPEGLVLMADMAKLVFEVAEGYLPIFLEFWAKASRDPEVWQATIAPYRRYRNFFVHMIETGISEGSLKPVDPDTAALVVVSLAIGLILQGLLDPEGADWGQAVQEGIHILLGGLETEPASDGSS